MSKILNDNSEVQEHIYRITNSNTNKNNYSSSRVASGIKNKTKRFRKSLKNTSKTKVSFKRKPRVKRFKNPIFLNLK